jgi:hypothetical protein
MEWVDWSKKFLDWGNITMKLQDCILEVDKVVVSSQEYIGPDEKWFSAKEKGYIPKSLYSLYSLAENFAFGKAPSYFNDTGRLLFPFMEGMARGIMDSLCESGSAAQ